MNQETHVKFKAFGANCDSFDYRMYLAKDKIYYICPKAQIEKVGENEGNKFYAAILKLKNKMAENINRVIPYPESALANVLIFGGSSELPKNLKDNFSKTGMTHIVSVSGYDVSIIAEHLILFGIFLGLRRKQAFWFAVIGIILFVAMIGFPSSGVRAGVMGTLLIWAMKNGRLANSWNAIIFAGAVMLLINPLLCHSIQRFVRYRSHTRQWSAPVDRKQIPAGRILITRTRSLSSRQQTFRFLSKLPIT